MVTFENRAMTSAVRERREEEHGGDHPVGPSREEVGLLLLQINPLSLGYPQDFNQINVPLGSWNALADNFRP